jgi:hypothetical protein
MHLVPPSRYGPPEKTYWEVETDYPGLVHGAFGAGKVAYFPWQPDALFYGHSLPEHKRIIATAVERVSGGRQISGNLPPQVEATVIDQPSARRKVVYLINYSGHQDRSFFPAIEFRDLAIRLNDVNVASARSAITGKALDVSEDGTITLPSLGWMDAIVLNTES